ncbi:MAG: rhodanese-like domain-containing protein, partial [Janthinobacterium lividum]
MKKSSNILLILAIIFHTFVCLACSDESAAKNKIQNTLKAHKYFDNELDFNTNPYGVNSDIKNKKDIVIVDIRAAKDYAAGHIPGAINLPMVEFNDFEGNETEFKGLRKDAFNYVYCYSMLCRGSQKACKKFAALG